MVNYCLTTDVGLYCPQSLHLSSCEACGTKIAKDTRALQCDRCDNAWKCLACMNLPVEIYEFLISKPNDLIWFCTNCESEPTNGQLSQMNALDKKNE